MKTFRKTLFAVALTAGIFTSFPALAENCVKPNLGGLTHRQKTENYPEMVDCAYRNVLAAKNADGNWVYLDNKTGKVLFTFPNGKQPGGLDNFYGSHLQYLKELHDRTSFHNGIDAFLDDGLVKMIDGSITDKNGQTIFNASKSNILDVYVFAKKNIIISLTENADVVFHDLQGKYLSSFKTHVSTHMFGIDVLPSNKNFAQAIQNGLIKIYNKEKNKAGYIDLSGNIVIPIEHKTLDNFSEGLVRASDPTNDKFIGYLDKKGKVVIPYEYNNFNGDDVNFTNGEARVCQDTCFYINKQGKRVKKSNNGSKKNKPLSFF